MDKKVCVLAGAGTGKTTVLVEKFIHLVTGDRCAGVDEVLAITFTEKAALEMKLKVLARLADMGLDNLRREAESAYISTIHGFCTRVLRENPVEAGVDPDFKVMDEVSSSTYMERALQTFFEDPPAELYGLLQLYEEEFVAEAVTRAIARYRSMGYSIDNFMHIPQAIGRLERIIEARKDILSRLAAEIKELAESVTSLQAVKALEEKRLEVVALASEIKTASPDVNVIKEMRNFCTRVVTKVPKDTDPEEYLQVADALKEIKTKCDAKKELMEADDSLEAEADEHSQWLHRAAYEVAKLYSSYKAELGTLDFEDLQMKAKELFTRHPHVLERYSGKFKAVLVDEYQDVNKLQAEIIKIIARRSNLFVVGDNKQLIYEFRDADPDLFDEFYNEIKNSAEGALYNLDESFRSRQAILDFINPFFHTLMKDMILSYHPIRSSDKLNYPRKELPSVEILIHPTAKGEKRDDAREIEAHAAASRIKEIVSLPKKELAKWGRKEPFSYGDVAVLFRSSPVIKIYEGALKARGIPYTVSKGSGFFQSREFIDALSLLQVIDNSEQDIPMAAVLRSPFVDINDDTLLILRVNPDYQEDGGGLSQAIHQSFKTDGLANEEREKIEKFSRLLTQLRAVRKISWPDELIERAVKETSYELRILSQDDGLQKLANIKKVVRFLREFRPETTGGLYDACRFMETARRAGINEKEAPLAPEGREAVNLITIHGAKGLEFPVVILADMGRDLIPAGKGRSIFVSEDFGICCKHRCEDREEVKNIGYILSSERQKERQKLEEYRLLYVAMTRTREHLIIGGSHDFSKELSLEGAKSPMQIVCAELGLNVQPGSTNVETIAYYDAHIKCTVVGKMEETATIQESPTLADRYRNEIASGLIIAEARTDKSLTELLTKKLDYADEPLPEKPLALSITSMLEYRQCPARYYFKYNLGLPEEVTFLPRNHGGTAGPELGSKVHALLNLIDFKEDLDVQLPELFRAVDLSSEAHEEAVKLLQNFTNSPIYAELRDADELRRELPFSLRLGDVNLSGAMDVLFQQDDGKRVLMDYKTDDVDEAGAEARSDSYFFQLSLYALAVKRTLGFVPHAIMLYFLRLNASLQKEVNEKLLENVKSEAIQIAAGIREEKFPLVKSSCCYSCAYGSAFCAILESRA